MMRRTLAPTLLAVLLATACQTDLPKDNPFDPDLPPGQKAPASLSGQVVLESGDATIATVEVQPAGKTAAPGAGGRFEISDIPPGTYTVRVSAEGHSTWIQGGMYFETGQDLNIGTVFVAAARGNVEGSVVLMLDPDNQADSHGGTLINIRPVEDVGGKAASRSSVSTISNPDGSWSVSSLPIGAWEIDASKDGYAPSPPVAVTVVEDETAPADALVLRSITGVVRIDGGEDYSNEEFGNVTVEVLAFQTDEMRISNDPELEGAEWEPHLAERPWRLEGADGEKTVYMQFRNHSGYVTPTVYDSIVLDREAPTNLSLRIAPEDEDEYVQGASVAVALDADDTLSGVAQMRTAVDGDVSDEPWVDFERRRAVVLPVGATPDGVTARVDAQFMDGAGNASEVVHDTVIVDSVAPQNPTIAINGDALLTAVRTVTLTLDADGASQMKVSNDPGLSGASWQPFVTSLGWGLTEGDEQKTVYAQYRDAAGNESVVVQDGIEMNTKGTVSGTFTLEGAAAGGHAGITVTLTTTPEQSQPTDADGHVAFSDVPVGMYTLRATIATHEDIVVPLVPVEPGQDTDVGERMMRFARGGLQGTAQLQGAAAGEHGGIKVEVLGAAGKLSFTSEDGAWQIEGIPVGQYTVRATAGGYLAATASDVSVVKDMLSDVGALTLTANPGSIAGSVTLEGLADPDLDIAEVLVAGQTVPTGADGSFLVSDVAAGTYTLTARAPGYGTEQVIAVVQPGQQAPLDPIALHTARGDLAGVAELENESDHSGILVEVQGTGLSALTNPLGEWTIRGVPTGQYTVRASAAGFNPALTPDVTIIEDEEVLVPDMTLTANPGSVTGAVELEDLAAGFWDGVTVTIEGTGLSEVSAADGSYTFGAVPAGTYPLTARIAGYGTAQTVITVAPGLATDAGTIALSIARGAIAGLATLSGEGDHSGITVEVDNQGYAGVTGVAGNYRIEGVPVGTVTLTAHKDGYTTRQVGAVTVVEDQTVTAADVALVRQHGDFAIRERATNDENYLNDPAVKLVFSVVPPDSQAILVSEDPAFAGASWESFSGLEHDHDLVSADGTVNVFAKFRDMSLAESPVFTASTVLDRVPPSDTSTVLINADADFSTSPDGQVTLNLEGHDPGGSGIGWVQVSTDGTLDTEPDQTYVTSLTPVTLDQPLVDGQKSVWVRFVDQAGNRSVQPEIDSIYLDRSVPVNSLIQINGAATYATKELVTLTLFARDACGPGYPGGGCVGGFAEPAQMMVSNDPGFQGGLWEAYATERNWFLKPIDGSKNVYVKFRDAAGNDSPRISASITLDGNPPGSPQVVIQGGEITGSRDVLLSLSATGAPDEMIVAEGGDFSGASWEPYDETPYPFTLSTGDGLKTVSARFRDAAGNETAVVQDTVVLDTAAPSGTLSIEEGEFVGLPDVTLLITGSPDATRLCVYGDVTGACDPASDPLTWPVTASPVSVTLTAGDGSKTVRAVLADDAGNKGAEFSDDTVFDEIPPVGLAIGIAGEGPTGYTRTAAVTLTLAAADATSGVHEMMLANDAAYTGANWEPYSGGATWTLDGLDGDKTVFFKARDRAGNEDETSGTIVLDRAAPTIGAFLIDDGAAYTTGASVTVDLPGTDNITADGDLGWCLANDATFAGAACGTGLDLVDRPWTLSPGDGAKVVYVRVTDAAGNAAETSDAIVMDGAAPTGGSLLIDGGEYSSAAGVNLTLWADDAAEMCLFGDITSPCDEADDGDWIPYNTSDTVTLTDPDGAKTVRVKYRDEASNVTGEAWDTVTLDRLEPVVFSVTLTGTGPSGFTRTALVTVETAADDATSEISEMKVSESDTFVGANWEGYSPARAWTLSSPDEVKTVYVRLRDRAGNTQDGSGSITLDREPPVLTAALAVSGNDGEPAGFSYDGTVLASFDVIDNVDSGSQITYWLSNDASFASAAPVPAPGGGVVSVLFNLTPGQGSHAVYVKVADRAGNEHVASDTIVVDGEAPGSIGLLLEPTDYSITGMVTAHLSAAGANEVCLTGDLAAPPAPDCPDPSSSGWQAMALSVPGLALSAGDGGKTVQAYFRDEARNVNGPVSDSVLRDGSDPGSPCAVVVSNGNVVGATRYVREGALDLGVTASDPSPGSGLAEMQVSENSDFFGAAWVPFASEFTTPLSSGDGAKTVYYRLRDAAGNDQDVACDSVTVTLDTEPPTANVVGLNGFLNQGARYVDESRVQIRIDCQDIHCHEVWVDGDVENGGDIPVRSWEDYGSYATGFVDLAAGNGPKTVQVRVQDNALNASQVAELAVYVDAAAPDTAGASVVLTGLAAGGPSTQYTRDRTVTVHLTGFSDADSGLWQMMVSESDIFAGASWQEFRDSFAHTLAPGEGPRTLYVKVRDRSGLESGTFSGQITVDTLAPLVNLTVTGTAALGDSEEVTRDRLVDLDIDVNDLSGTGAFEMETSRDGDFTGAWVNYAASVGGYDLYEPAVPTCRDRGVLVNELSLGTNDRAELVNATSHTVDLTGWQFQCGWDTGELTWTLPDFQLGPGEYVSLRDGSGADGPNTLWLGGDCQWDSAIAGWGTLWDAEGNGVDFLRFNDSAQAPPADLTWTEDAPLIGQNRYSRTNLEFDRDLASDWCRQNGSLEAPNLNDCGLVENDCEDVSGDRAVYVQVQDFAGNVGVASAEILLDVLPPGGSVTIGDGAAYATSPVVNLDLGYSDDLSGAQIMRLGEAADTYGAWQDPVDVLTYTLTGGDGPNKVYARFIDRAGNQSPSFADGIEVDTQVPTCTATLRGFRADGTQNSPGVNDTHTGLRTVELLSSGCSGGPTGIATADENVGLNCATAGYNDFAATAFVTLGDGDGDKRAHVCYRDDAGNVTAVPVLSSQLTLDQTPPSSGTIFAARNNDDQPATHTRSTLVDLFLSAEAATGMRHSRDPDFAGDAWETYTTAKQDETLLSYDSGLCSSDPTHYADGITRTVYGQFRDDLYNESPVVTYDIVYDRCDPGVPTVAISPTPGANGAFSNSRDLVISIGNLDHATGMHVFGMNNAACSGYSSHPAIDLANSATMTFSSDGFKRACVRLRDAAGNVSADDGEDTITIDTVPPTAPNLSPGNIVNANYSCARITPSGVSETNFWKWQYRSNGGPWTNSFSGSYIQFDLLQDTDNSLEIRAVDDAGNVGVANTAFVEEVSSALIPTQLTAHMVCDGGDFIILTDMRRTMMPYTFDGVDTFYMGIPDIALLDLDTLNQYKFNGPGSLTESLANNPLADSQDWEFWNASTAACNRENARVLFNFFQPDAPGSYTGEAYLVIWDDPINNVDAYQRLIGPLVQGLYEVSFNRIDVLDWTSGYGFKMLAMDTVYAIIAGDQLRFADYTDAGTMTIYPATVASEIFEFGTVQGLSFYDGSRERQTYVRWDNGTSRWVLQSTDAHDGSGTDTDIRYYTAAAGWPKTRTPWGVVAKPGQYRHDTSGGSTTQYRSMVYNDSGTIYYRDAYNDTNEYTIGTNGPTYGAFYEQRAQSGSAETAWLDDGNPKRFRLNENYSSTSSLQDFRYSVDSDRPILSTYRTASGEPMVIYHTGGLGQAQGVVIGYRNNSGCAQ